MKNSQEFDEMFAQAHQSVQEINVGELNDRIANDHDHFYLLDVREDWEWEQGHIFGAVHIGRGLLEFMVDKLIPNKSAEIVTYCRGGQRSVLAAKTLQALGYQNVKSLEGGITAWVAAGDEIDGELLDREEHFALLKEQMPEIGFDQ